MRSSIKFLGMAGICLALVFMPAFAAAQGLSLIRDEEIEQILKTFARPVFQQAGVSPDTVRFILVDDPDLNAFVAGGQNIFLHTGLLLKTENAEEVIGVIAHETGHIALGHLFRLRGEIENVSAQALLSQLLGIAVAIGSGSSGAGAAVASAGQHAATRGILQHSRTQESAADQAAVRFLRESHMSMTGLLTFMQKLESQELLPASQQSEYIRTHPLTQDRISFLIHAEKEKLLPAASAEFQALHNRMQAKLTGYLFPDRALTDKSPSLNTQYAHAIARYRKGEMQKALDGIDVLLRAEPENPYFHELKGQVLFESGQVKAALAPYTRAVDLAPGSGLIRLAYGHALLESADGHRPQLRDAVEQFKRALKIEPRMARAHHLLAIVYGKLGEEGLSRLHLAEKYVLMNDPKLARQEVLLALNRLPKDSPATLRANDILDIVMRQLEKEK